MLLWSTFLEGTAKIHIHMLVVAPVKVRNSIDITSISEITKTTTMTTLSTSLKLSFTDVVETAPWRTDRATPRPLWNEDKKYRDRQRFPEKSLLSQVQECPGLLGENCQRAT